jgi:hypothetical protein
MKEFMLLVRNEIESKEGFSPVRQQEFLNACEVYIEDLMKKGNLKSAQPLAREGKMISGSDDTWSERFFTESEEVIVGYYHIMANDIEEAIAIAKGNPEFVFTDSARIEVRPVKMKEETTDYIYPYG